MAGLGSNTSSSAVTPFRVTHVRFDISEPTAAEPPFAIQRYGNEIARDRSQNVNVSMLASGTWRLQAYQEVSQYIHERSDNVGAVMEAAHFTLAPGIVPTPRFRSPADLPGLTVGPNVMTSGDTHLVKRVAAGADWNSGLTADEAAFPRPTLPTTNTSMSRLAVSVVNLNPDEGTTFSFETTGTRIHAPDNLFIYYFGGPAASDGRGTFAVMLHGDGRAQLFERVNDTWLAVESWEYCAPTATMHAYHEMSIIPHRLKGARGQIEFRHHITGAAPLAGGGILTSYHTQLSAPRSHVVDVLFGDNTPVRTAVTGAGPVRVCGNDGQRAPFRITRWRFPTLGTLWDGDFHIPFRLSTRAPFALFWEADIPLGCSVVGKVYNSATDAELPLVTDGGNYRIYTPIYQQSQYYIVFTLTGDGTATPALFGYGVTRDGIYITPSGITEFTGGVIRSVNISGGEAEPSHETATMQIDDSQNSLSTLRTRASIPVQIETEYDPGDSSLRSVLFRGYAERNMAQLIGNVGKQGLGAGGATKAYPAAKFYRFNSECVGMWTRLHEMLLFARINLAEDKSAAADANGVRPAMKITDVVRGFIAYAGFPSTMIDIPDSPVRFFPIPGNADALIVQPLTNIGEWVVKTLRDWLGWFLVWDGNAGAAGMFRAIAQPVSPYRNLAIFTMDAPSAGKLIHRPESYGSTNWTGTDLAPVTAPILRVGGQGFQSWVKRPEANHVVMTGTGQLLPNRNGQNKLTNFATNFKSFDGMATSGGATFHSADPTNPDYLGRFVPLVVVDPTMQTCEAVGWFARRFYDITCHAIKMCSFTAPLVLVTDTADAHQTRPRPLRYYDAVQIIDGGVASQWLVRSANPVITKDGIQMMTMELEAPRF